MIEILGFIAIYLFLECLLMFPFIKKYLRERESIDKIESEK